MPGRTGRESKGEPGPDAARSANMARIGARDTGPELAVRRLLHRLGYRYRLHKRELPGTPDICFPGRRKAIFVHGCFWHRHDGCRRTTTPKTRTAFWKDKFDKNVVRDRTNMMNLGALGWGNDGRVGVRDDRHRSSRTAAGGIHRRRGAGSACCRGTNGAFMIAGICRPGLGAPGELQ